jgi:hypothetical protein
MGDLEIRESGGSRDGLFPTLPAFHIQQIWNVESRKGGRKAAEIASEEWRALRC